MISVIIPVYNAEKYLRETIQSVLNQTYQDFEIVAVNDGSTDHSLKILESISDPRLKIINKENTGVSDTRNVALHAAMGEYICFLDADDYLSRNYLQHMYRIVENKNADMVVCNYVPFRGTPVFIENKVVPQFVQSTKILAKADVLILVGTKLIKKSTLFNNHILFENKMTYGEDLFFCWKTFLVSKNVWMIDETLYGYRMTPSGATSKYHANLYEKYKSAFEDLKHFSDDEHYEMDVFFTTRIPSFIRMTIREKSGILQKRNRLKYILGDPIIKKTLQNWDEFVKEIKPAEVSLYKKCRDGKIYSLLIYGYKGQLRNNLSFFKSRIKG